MAPVYDHTHLGGAIVDEPSVGPFLRELLFGVGQSMRWDELLERTTGQPLSVASLERELTSLQVP